MFKPVTSLQPNGAGFSLPEDKSESRKTLNKQQLKVAAVKAWQSISRGGNSTFGDIHGSQTSGGL